MTYVKKLVMHGFKSFAKKTEILFDKGINVIVGPNGAGKSNVSDALCFVLGRLSIKSIRAAKAKNLLFMGSKYIKPAKEAYVELVFDNSNKTFALNADEIVLQRIVKRNGQSIYKINNEVKTRIEIIETLAQAGIDPYGFNLILQGKIQEIVKIHPEDRRKIIEEVAGISIYETRKEKSIKELEKTEERLKEVSSVLRQRTAYLKNLDEERAEALRFKELELVVKRARATLLSKKQNEKLKEINSLISSMNEKNGQKEKIKSEFEAVQNSSLNLGKHIEEINKHIQEATGLEQESLHNNIANLKAELEGLRVRKDSYENRKSEIERRISEMRKSIPEMESEIKQLNKESPMMAQKSQELKLKKEELEKIEEERNKVLALKSELNALRERAKDREQRIGRVLAESENTIKQLEESQKLLNYKNIEECLNALSEMKKKLEKNKKDFSSIIDDSLKHEKEISVCESEISRALEISKSLKKIDLCPLCQSKITEEHRKHVEEAQEKILKKARETISKNSEILNALAEKKKSLDAEVKEIETQISKTEIENLNHEAMKEKHEHLKKLVEEEKALRSEIRVIEEKRKHMEEKSSDLSLIEERREEKMLEIEEISSRTEEDIDTTLLYKQRDLEKIQGVIKINQRDIEELKKEIHLIEVQHGSKQKQLATKEEQEKELQKKFKKLFEDREDTQKQIHEENMKLNEIGSEIRAIDEQINYFKIGKAKLDAEKEAIEMELRDYMGIELLQGSQNALQERLQKAQESLQKIGSINLRALEVYEQVKKEYDIIQEKANTIEKEKHDILSIVAEIDLKKKRSFMKTFKALSERFSQNFSKLYTKGIAFLELENKEDIFAGGVNIVVRLAKGKYFDVASLSGGEQTLVALSLLFAIQEYKPYHFYVLDEIDAALDKRNSERLAVLLNQYMKSGQYIIVTHNDAIIMNANLLYGVSMHDNASKVLSLNLEESLKMARDAQEQQEQQQEAQEKEDAERIKKEKGEAEAEKQQAEAER